ncbi:MAG: molybdate ABC transporter substrate-binding protein [Caldilinea sp. CFX5]|nr:molybdate ABC transporter substrate-binding protein [Caldilinea sp. CFX5]
MRRVLPNVLMLTLSLVLAACAPIATPAATSNGDAVTEQTTLTIFAAASLTDAFQTIGKNFSPAHPGVEVVFNFGGSQQLAQQIGQGAPADLFASANARQMGVAIESGRVVSGMEQIFVRNRLVVVTPVDNPAGVAVLADLAKPGLKIVLAAKEVPVGQYSLDFLDKAEADGSLGAGYRAAVLTNVVSYEENVRTVLAKVTLGEADAGIVYRSDVTPVAAEQVQRIDIPDNLNTIAGYPIAPLSDSPHAALAQQFIGYLLSPEGQQILEDAGFMPLAER